MARPILAPSCFAALFLLLSSVLSATAEFTQADLLADFDGNSFKYFKTLLTNSTVASDFMEQASFEGSFLAFTDAAFETFAQGHGYDSAQQFIDEFATAERATEIINLHIIPKMNANTTASEGERPTLLETSGSGIVKVVFGDDGPSSFVYPTLNFMSDASGSDAESTGRKLLTEHSSDIIKTVQGGDPNGSKQVHYVSRTLAPISLVNEQGSKQESAYFAIKATPCLSMLTSLLDIDIAEVRSLRDTLNSTSFNGTVMAPHDDALHTLFSALDITPTAFATRFPSALSQILQYHVLPYAFNITGLTRPGNGVIDTNRPRPGLGEKGGSSGGGSNSGGRNPTRKMLDSDVEVDNRFQTSRPGASFDLHVIKTGNGRVFVRGARTQVDLMAADSQISIGDTSFVHVIDGVLRFSNIATDASVEALFGESSSMRPSTSSFKSVSSLLEKLGLESRLKDLNDATLIAPSDVAFENLAKARGFSNADLLGASNAVLEKIIKAHIIKLGSSDIIRDGQVYATELVDANLRININDDGTLRMTSTTDAPTAGGKKRHLLADGDEASIDSTTTTEDGQVMYSDGTLVSASSDDDLNSLSSSYMPAPISLLIVTIAGMVLLL